MKKFVIILLILLGFLTSCDDATVVSHNISKKADNFEIKRRIVFFNGITDTILMEIIGYCSIFKDNQDNQLEVTCKVGDGKYKKHYFGLSDNTAYFVEQIDADTASAVYYRVVFKPQSIVPSLDIRVSPKTPSVDVNKVK